jgi:hypothetical protein
MAHERTTRIAVFTDHPNGNTITLCNEYDKYQIIVINGIARNVYPDQYRTFGEWFLAADAEVNAPAPEAEAESKPAPEPYPAPSQDVDWEKCWQRMYGWASGNGYTPVTQKQMEEIEAAARAREERR